jgi:hypothetical protein
VAGTLTLVVTLWLVALSIGMRRAHARTSAAPSEEGPRKHPHQGLLDRIDSLTDALRVRDEVLAVDWQLGEIYNSVLAEAQRLNARVGAFGVVTATRSADNENLTTQSASTFLASLGQIRAIVADSDAR